jgi:hypothetical protein
MQFFYHFKPQILYFIILMKLNYANTSEIVMFYYYYYYYYEKLLFLKVHFNIKCSMSIN